MLMATPRPSTQHIECPVPSILYIYLKLGLVVVAAPGPSPRARDGHVWAE